MRLFTIFLGVASLTPLCLFSQRPSAQGTPTQTLPPGFVDGSKNPGAIPDYASYRLLMMRLSSLMNATDARAALRQAAVFTQIGLSAADTQVLQSQIAAFSVSYSQWTAAYASSPSAAGESAAQAIALAARDALLKGFSSDGVSKFTQYVAAEKSHMVVKP